VGIRLDKNHKTSNIEDRGFKKYMAIKTNKSYSKRLKVTKNGKILSRKAGQNHFNAKESRRRNQLRKKRTDSFVISNKSKSKFLVNI